jgi:hypothetical protein
MSYTLDPVPLPPDDDTANSGLFGNGALPPCPP